MKPAMRYGRGFSLLELLVAIAILALSLGMLYQASTGSLRSAGDIAAVERAAWLAQSLLASRDAVPASGWNESGENAGVRWQVQSRPLPVPAGLRADAPVLHEVVLTLQWTDRRGPRSQQWRTSLPQELAARTP